MIKVLKFLNLSFFIIMIVVNCLANLLPLGLGKTGEISKRYENLFTPAGITFFIWAIIYLLLGIFIIYQFDIFGNQIFERNIVSLIGCWFIISCIMNIGWLFSWHYDIIWLSMIFMLGLLFSLMMIVRNFTPNNIEQITGISSIAFMEKIGLYGFDLYLGWITAATIANASVLLVKIEWNRFGMSDQFWTIIVLLVGAILGIVFIASGQRYMSAVGIIWAYIGIIIKHVSKSGYAGAYPAIIATAIIGIVAILFTMKIKMILTS